MLFTRGWGLGKWELLVEGTKLQLCKMNRNLSYNTILVDNNTKLYTLESKGVDLTVGVLNTCTHTRPLMPLNTFFKKN